MQPTLMVLAFLTVETVLSPSTIIVGVGKACTSRPSTWEAGKSQ